MHKLADERRSCLCRECGMSVAALARFIDIHRRLSEVDEQGARPSREMGLVRFSG